MRASLVCAKELRLIDYGASIPNKPRGKKRKRQYAASKRDRFIERVRKMPYREYLKTPHWKKFRQKILRIAKFQCFDCGSVNAPLEVHHLHYNTLGREKPRDCLVLCRGCHAARHSDKARQVDEISREFQEMFR